MTPPWPHNPDDKTLIHIGCGMKNSTRYINVDAEPLAHVHIVTYDLSNIDELKTESADLIYMCHVLEHIPPTQLHSVLSEIRRILKPGGILRLSVPDFNKLIEIYHVSGGDVNSIYRQLLGQPGSDYNAHHMIFNDQYLRNLLEVAGFRNVTTWDPQNSEYHDFKDTSSKTIRIDSQRYPVSLNLEAIK